IGEAGHHQGTPDVGELGRRLHQPAGAGHRRKDGCRNSSWHVRADPNQRPDAWPWHTHLGQCVEVGTDNPAGREPPAMSDPLFKDLLVLDCASFVAGPAAATIMSDFGARVIKIEPPEIGDSYRQLIHLPGTPVSDRDYYWMLDNRNKESLALDLKQDA